MTVSERERFLTSLLERSDGKELVNIKFFGGEQSKRETEATCAAARRVVEQIWAPDAALSTVPPDADWASNA